MLTFLKMKKKSDSFFANIIIAILFLRCWQIIIDFLSHERKNEIFKKMTKDIFSLLFSSTKTLQCFPSKTRQNDKNDNNNNSFTCLSQVVLIVD